MFKTILIGYDGPERGGEATALAEVLRDTRTGTLLLVSAIDEGLAIEADDMLTEACGGLRERDRVQTRAVASDTPGRMLREAAEAEHADLVVVGSGRRSALGRPLPGTAADRLAGDPPCAVAVAPPGYTARDIRRIGVAYDGSSASDAALRAAESLALELRAPITVYRAVDPAAPSAAMSAPQGLTTETLVLHGVPADEIAGRAYGVVDVLFVGAADRGPLRRALLNDVSGALVRAAGCPVVVTPCTAAGPVYSSSTAAASTA